MISNKNLQPGIQPDFSEQVNSDGLACLTTIAGFHGIAIDTEKLRHEFGMDSDFSPEQIMLAARATGMAVRRERQDMSRISQAPLPAIAQDKNGKFFIIAKSDSSTAVPLQQRESPAVPVESFVRVLIQYDGQPMQVLTAQQLTGVWDGFLIFFKSSASYAGNVAKFDFTWFIPSLIKYRKLLGEALYISVALQVFGLITPMFFQVIMDKVLVNHSMQTLNVIVFGLLCAILFESTLGAIRSYVLANMSSKIDVELGARLFKHVLQLPISYFHARKVGDTVARIRELENIRAFLTGNSITLVLDLLFSFIFFIVMLWYSPTLTGVVAASIPLYLIVSLIFTPLLRLRLNDKFTKGAENQSFLVESLNGIDTIKALAVEPRWQQKWDRQLAGYVAASLSTTNISIIASAIVSLVGKITTAVIMWFGASLVVDGKLTVGELIAFNMLAGQVSSPILRLAQLWNDFQQIGISMSRLGDILNTRSEVVGQKPSISKLIGAVEFENLSFRYRPDTPDVIRSLSLKIKEGEVVGIVGRSGSGKSTLTKLVQRLYVPDRGRILIDGLDLGLVETSSLRRQIGVVLQENVLFARSIRENIALCNPSLPIESVIEAAKLAGAHEFICDLPEGYDTKVGEHGTGLSGGQKQRVAIARALISNPRILIFDEATSALDYESERIIHDNMQRICKGRTVLIVAHRLTAVRDADRIVVMDHGKIAETGNHEYLLGLPSGIYAQLYSLQMGSGMSRVDPLPGQTEVVV